MAWRSNAGYTVYHLAAAHGHLSQVPAHLLTLEVVLKPNDIGNTLVHEAAEKGTLAQHARALRHRGELRQEKRRR